MPYIGKHPSAAPVAIALGAITTDKLSSDFILPSDKLSTEYVTVLRQSIIDREDGALSHVSDKLMSIIVGAEVYPGSDPLCQLLFQEAEGYQRGDIDNDGNITIADVNDVLQYIVDVQDDISLPWLREKILTPMLTDPDKYSQYFTPLIKNSQLADDAVTVEKLDNGAVTLAKLGTDVHLLHISQAADIDGKLSLTGGTLTGNLNVNGSVTATSFSGDGSSLTNLPAGGATNLNGLTDAVYDNSSLGIGINALLNDDGWNINTAVGVDALKANVSGTENTAIGADALTDNTTGYANTASGRNALYSNTTGTNNVATGTGAMQNNTGGSYNTASGKSALSGNKTGSNNVAVGNSAMFFKTGGHHNVAVGKETLLWNTTGSKNVALGYRAGYNETGSDKLHIANNDTESLIEGDFSAKTLTVNGTVTMPYQPAFQASNHAAGDTTGNINYTHTLHNIGGHFNASTGRFTAPTAGMYSFSFHALTENKVSTGNVEILINGGNPSGNIFRNYMDNSVGKYRPISIGGMFYLNASDYVSIYSPTLILHGNQSEHFSGHLIG